VISGELLKVTVGGWVGVMEDERLQVTVGQWLKSVVNGRLEVGCSVEFLKT